MINNSEIIYKAPGRICLFGDHQDYLGLPIIACAIDRYIKIIAQPNENKVFYIEMPDIKTSRIFSIDDDFTTLQKGDHIASSIRVVKRYGCIPNRGYSIQFEGNIPINAGLSSSSALVVVWVRFLLETFGCSFKITNELIAKIAYESEVLEQNSPGGKMDQYTIALGDIIFLQTNENTKYRKIDTSLEGLVVGASGIPKNTIGLLGNLKEKALRAIQIVQDYDKTFDLVKIKNPERFMHLLPEGLKPMFDASVKNHQITQAALIALKENPLNYQKIGNLINQHHHVLRDLLKITTPKIDAMIDAAISAGAYGAKIVGSGGGGSICALTSVDKQHQVIDAIINAGAQDAFAVSVSPSINHMNS